ncbi:MAG: hypothetical protein HYY18_19395 [Planctomycetes bacterium]|nr:hypothetical protein [Planctomycetota bacterium]
MIRTTALLLLTASCALAEGRAAAPPPKELLEARQKICEELVKFRAEMAKQGYKGEVDDIDSILKKIAEPDKMMNDKGMGTPYPGDDRLKELMKAWSDLGDRLAAIYNEAAGKVDGEAKDELEKFAGWFDSWKHVAAGVLHLNRRRKFCKLTPVMADWSGSWGGYLHGRYLKLNANHPSAQGLGAHNENNKLPGYTLEGAAAAGGILGGGSAEYVMDSWLGSEYHRDPVFSRNCSRVCFGGLPPGGWWSCRNGGGGSGSVLGDVLTFPGDGDTEIPTVFSGEGPNPLAKFGMDSSGTFVVVDFLRGRLKKPTPRLLDPDGKEVEIIRIGTAPMSFVAKEPLKGESKYVVEIVGSDGAKFSFSFTTAAERKWPGGGGGEGDGQK